MAAPSCPAHLLLPAWLALFACLTTRPATAQHPHSDTIATPAPLVHARLAAGAVPLVTRATPTAGRAHLTEAYLAHPVAMLHATTWRDRLSLDAMLNLEGITLGEGELNTGAHGEGYVDRRHPHSYVHEAMLGVRHRAGRAELSLFAGRGFASFGSDDPMVRPLAKYPLNHHLAQVLERVVVVGALRAGPVSVEASAFNGDEPEGPASMPAFGRVGDSWAARVTASTAAPLGHTAEWSASRAWVVSPESREGLGLDHHMWHASVRLRGHGRVSRYLLAEVMGLQQLDEGVPSHAYRAHLVEGALCARREWIALRWEMADRPEESRTASLFRTPFPHAGDAILGRTSWTIMTAAMGSNGVATLVGGISPFIELSALRPRQLDFPSLVEPALFYGARTLALLSVGARLRLGAQHHRMGRYGAALPHASDRVMTHASSAVRSHGRATPVAGRPSACP